MDHCEASQFHLSIAVTTSLQCTATEECGITDERWKNGGLVRETTFFILVGDILLFGQTMYAPFPILFVQICTEAQKKYWEKVTR